MKKILSVVLACCLLAAFAGCSNKNEGGNVATPSSLPTVSEVQAELEKGGQEAAQLILDNIPLGKLTTLLVDGTSEINGVEYYHIIAGMDTDTGSDIEFTETAHYYVPMDYSVIYEYDPVDDVLLDVWYE